jgi:cytoskeleton protein RodZ
MHEHSHEKDSYPQVVHIGEYLKSQREHSKISIEKISQKTKINLNILKSLEANDFTALPSPAYVKGFVLSYARVLGLSHDEVINKLEYSYLTLMGKPFPNLNPTRSEGAGQRSEDFKDPAKVLDEDKRIAERKKLVLPLTLAAGLIIGVFSFYQVLTKTIKNEIKVPPPQPVTTTPVPDNLLDDPQTVISDQQAPTTQVESELVATPQVVTKTEPKIEPKVTPPVKEVVTPVKPVEVPVVKVEEKPKDQAIASPETVTPKPVTVKRIFPPKDFREIKLKLFAFTEANDEVSALLTPEIREKFNKNLENIFITAVDGSTWLSYKIDEGPIEGVQLAQGGDLFLQGKKILLFFGNVKVTRIFYQNKLIDAPTPTGFKSLVFPESETKNHLLPLFPKAENGRLYTAEEYIRRMNEEEKKLAQ